MDRADLPPGNKTQMTLVRVPWSEVWEPTPHEANTLRFSLQKKGGGINGQKPPWIGLTDGQWDQTQITLA